MTGADSWTGEPARDNSAEAEAIEQASNARTASARRDGIASWLAGLIEQVEASEPDGVRYRPNVDSSRKLAA